MKFLVLGAGWISQVVHLPFICATTGFELVGVVEPMAETCATVASRRQVASFASLAEVPATLDVDVAVVCTPPDSHADLVIQCLGRGWHVICEKPLCFSAEDCRRIFAARRASGRSLRVCQTGRFRQDTGALIAACRAGVLGEVRYARLSWLRERGVPRTAGGRDVGVLWDLGAHLADLSVAIQHGAVEAVQAAGCWLGAEVAERSVARWQGDGPSRISGPLLSSAVVNVSTGDGRLAALEMAWSTLVPPDQTEVRVLGSDGSALLRTVFGNSPARGNAATPSLTITRYDSGGPTAQVDTHGSATADYEEQNRFLYGGLQSGGVWPPQEELLAAVGLLEAAERELSRSVGVPDSLSGVA